MKLDTIKPAAIRSTMRSNSGFTLIEVMIVVVIVAILVSIALPAYQGSLQKGRRSDARASLMDVLNRQEQFMLDRNSYTFDLADLGYTTPYVTPEGHYTITAAACAVPNDRCFVLTATPIATSPQAKDARCVTFTLNSAGDKNATGDLIESCW